MTAPRGGRGGERGRGTRGSSAPNRGANTRGRGNGSLAHNTGERPAQGVYTRGQAGQRGGRGSAIARGTPNARGNAHGRGGNANVFTSIQTGPSNSTPHVAGDYKKRLDHIKDARPKVRAQFIQDGLMNPEGQMRLSDSVKLIGICTDMCPEFERVRRIVEEDVKAPECTPETEHLPRKQRIPDESRMVKAYARSAAGVDVELVSEIRSPATCLKTIDYLFERLDHDEFQFLHRWTWDRTRAIRKDLRTQRIERKPDINILLTCLERSARFLLLSTHHMARSTKEDYTHQQDIEQLNQTLMSLKERYVDNRRASIPSESEAEFWAYRLILAPIYANIQLENELHQLPSDVQFNPRVKTAIEIFRVLKSVIITNSTAMVQAQSNWKKFWDLIKSPRVSYLMACAAEISFNRVRHVVLDSIWRSYRRVNQKHLVTVDDWTPNKLKNVLGLDTEAEAVKHCEAYGFIFKVTAAGNTFLDITQKGYANHVLGMPPASSEFKPQIFSASIVEAKRYDRALSSVIQGASVQQARNKGLLVDAEVDMQVEEEMEGESLFVPNSSNGNIKPFLQQNNGTGATEGFMPTLNPAASFFQAGGAQVAATNPFLQAASQTQSQSTSTTVLTNGTYGTLGSLGQTVSNGESSAASSTTLQSTPAIAPVNPFVNGGVASAPPQPNPFAQFTTPKPTFSSGTTTPSGHPAFDIEGVNQVTVSQESRQPTMTFTPAGLPPTVDTASVEAEQQAERDRRHAAEKQRQEVLARQRVEAARDAQRRAREAQEAEHRRKQEEAAEQLRRQLQLQKEQEQKANQEKKRLLREAQRCQAQEEEARAAKIREQESALQSLTADVMFHDEEGLMLQFIENTALNVAQEVMLEVEMERKDALGDKLYHEYQLTLKRAGLAKIIAYVGKKNRAVLVRERRKRLKAQRAQAAQEEEVVTVPASLVTMRNRPPKDSAHQRPAATPSVRRAQRTEERRGAHENIKTTGTAPTLNGAPKTLIRAALSEAKPSNSNALRSGYSKAYQQSTAPIDRTETDWFKLRAMGIDPSKHRKRSFDSTSGEDDPPQVESKRPRVSPTVIADIESPPSFTTAEDQLARFRAVQQAFKKSSTMPIQAHHGMPSDGGRLAANSSTNDVIARAREIVADAYTPKSAIPSSHTMHDAHEPHVQHDVQHDWGRSVPNLSFAASSSRQSALRVSTNDANPLHRPAYWQRASRFVPRHLYGQGREAIRAYNDQYVKRSPANSTRPVSIEPPAQSSPIPTQLSYLPPPQNYSQEFTPQQYSEDYGSRGIEGVNIDHSYDDGNVIMTDEEGQQYGYNNVDTKESNYTPQHTQYSEEDEDADSEMDDGEDEDEEEGPYRRSHHHLQRGYGQAKSEESSESTKEDGDSSPQPAQRHTSQSRSQSQRSQSAQAGTTQDDAIELSD